MIRFLDVSKKYENGSYALNNLNLNISKGEFVFIIGHSGAGKSTLTKLLIREIKPSAGQIFIDGKNLNRLKSKEIAHFRRTVGFVFQDFRLLQDRTAFENVAFALEAVALCRNEVCLRAEQSMRMVGLGDKLDNFPNQLSGGEQQRIAIARAIVNTPSLLIADEPTGNLDQDNAVEIMKILDRINRRGTTVVVTTHNTALADMLKRRVITLRKGMVIRDTLYQRGYVSEL